MSEVWVRVIIVTGALIIAVVVSVIVRRGRARPIEIGPTGLAPGVYLFTSEECSACGEARAGLEERFVGATLTQVRWEDSPEIFKDLGVGEVPATIVVSNEGIGTLLRGLPNRTMGSEILEWERRDS